MSQPRVSLQLWSVRDDMRRDFAATVAEVARIGYAGVELAGYGNLDVHGVKTALERAKLVVSGMHVGRQALTENLASVISDARLLGTRDVICPSWPKEEFTDRAACESIGEELDRVGALLRAAGLRFSFHNHAAEMALHENRTVFDWMVGAAQPRNLVAEPDVYWIHVGGQSPEKFLRAHGARCPLIHLKDETELGLGPVDFSAVFAAAESVGAAEWYVVEQEKYARSPLDSVRACFEQLRKWGKV
jgi:sugar phosphate isomerase/epimerase